MPNYLAEYQEYYRLRMQRYANNPDYARSYAAEKALYEAIASCQTLEEFKTKLGNLNQLAATALLQDEYALRLRHYEAMEETVKAAGCRRILEKTAAIEDVVQLTTVVNEEEHLLNLECTADTIYPFADFGYLERYTIWAEAEVPPQYRKQYDAYAAEEKTNLQKAYASAAENIGKFCPGWRFDFTRINETRHRRLLPLPAEVVNDYIEQTQKLLQ